MGCFHFGFLFDVVILILEDELNATVVIIEVGDFMEDVFEVVFFVDVLVVSLGFLGFFLGDDAEIGISFKNLLMSDNFRGGFVAS